MRIDRQLWFWFGACAVLLLLIGMLREVLLPFVTGIVIAYFLNPIADRLQRAGLSRVWASILIVGLGAVCVAALLVFIAPLMVNQTRQLASTLPSDLDRLKALLDDFARERLGSYFPAYQANLERALAELTQNWTGALAAFGTSLLSRGLAFVNFLSLLLVTPIVVFYLLVDWHPMLDRIDGWLPRDHAPAIRRLAGETNNAIAAFIRGQGTICLLLAAFYAIGLSFTGLKYGLLIGLATGIMIFVPVVGWLLGLLVALTFGLIQWGAETVPLLKVAGVFAAGQVVDSALLSPKIVGKKIGLHPVWMIFALFAFSYLFGFVGTIIAVPLAAAVGVIVRFALQTYLGSSLYMGQVNAESDRSEMT